MSALAATGGVGARPVRSHLALGACGVILGALAIAVGVPAPCACFLLAVPHAVRDDLRTRTIPNRPLAVAAVMALVVALATDGGATALRMVLAGAVVLAAFVLAWLFGPEETMGLGDSKMAALSACCLAAVSPGTADAIVWGVLVIPVLTAIPVVAWCARRSPHRAAPFAPCLGLGLPLALGLRALGIA